MKSIPKNAYAQVNQILNCMSENTREKIPLDVRNLFQEKGKVACKMNMAENRKIGSISISRTAFILLCVLNLQYLEEDPQKREELKKIYVHNEIEHQKRVNKNKKEYYQWNQKLEQLEENNLQTSLINQKDITIIDKIKNFFKNLIRERK